MRCLLVASHLCPGRRLHAGKQWVSWEGSALSHSPDGSRQAKEGTGTMRPQCSRAGWLVRGLWGCSGAWDQGGVCAVDPSGAPEHGSRMGCEWQGPSGAAEQGAMVLAVPLSSLCLCILQQMLLERSSGFVPEPVPRRRFPPLHCCHPPGCTSCTGAVVFVIHRHPVTLPTCSGYASPHQTVVAKRLGSLAEDVQGPWWGTAPIVCARPGGGVRACLAGV